MTQFYSALWVIIALASITQGGSSDIMELKCDKVDIVESLGLLDVKCYNVTTSANSTDSVCNPLDGINFQCKSYGKFPDTSVPNCKGYIFCVARDNGTFILNRYQCPEGSIFNYATKICTVNYTCPCDNSNTETTTVNYANSTGVTIENTTLIDTTTAENPQMTTIVPITDTIIDQTTENTNTGFPPTQNETILTTTKSTTTDESITICNPLEGGNFQCTNYGRFLDESVSNCKGYIFCVTQGNGVFVLTRYLCPEGTFFNNVTKMCTANYSCPCDSSIAGTTVTTISADITATNTSTENPTITAKTTTVTEITVAYTTTENPTMTTLTTSSTDITTVNTITENPTVTSETTVSTEITTANTTTGYSTVITSTSSITEITAANRTTGNPIITSETTNDKEITEVYATTENPTGTKETSSSTEITAANTTTENPSVTTVSTSGTEITTVNTITENPIVTAETTSSIKITTVNTTTENPTETTDTSSITEITAANITTENPIITTETTNSTEITEVNTTTENPTGTKETSSSTEITAANTTIGNQTVTIVTTSSTDITTSNTTTENPTVTAETTSSTGITATNTITENPIVSTETSSITEITTSNNTTGNPIMTTETTSSTENTTVTKTTENPIMTTVLIPDTTHNQTTPNPNTESTICNVSNGLNFHCIQNGSFPDESAVNCTGYILCSSLHDGTFNLTRHQCPDNTYFNNDIKVCTANYTCPCILAATTPSLNETTSNTASNPSESLCNPLDGIDFQCVDYGRFLDESVPDCKGFIFCVTQGNGVFLLTRYQCPDGTIFNNMTKMCTANYTCPCDSSNSATSTVNYTNSSGGLVTNSTLDVTTENLPVTTIIPTPDTINDQTSENPNTASASNSTPISTSLTNTTTSIELTSTTTDLILSNFKCNASGRYEDESDSNCSGFIYCAPLGNDTFALSRYTCPIGTLFNPYTSMCTRTYVCPSTSNSSLAPSIEATSIISTESTSTATPELITIPSSVCNSTFECQTTGRFPDYSVSGCKKYIYCVETNGIMETMLYTCPSVYVFDAERGICANPSMYTCPC